MASLVFNAFENETYDFEENGQKLKDVTSGGYKITNDYEQDESGVGARRHTHLQSSNSLAPLLTSGSPESDFSSTRFATVNMPRAGTVTSNGGISPPPLPHAKSHPRVFSKKGKGSTQGPVPIPGPRIIPRMDTNRSPDVEGWEMSMRESGDSGLRSVSFESPSSPQDWCFTGQFDVDSSQDDQRCSYLKPLDSPMSEQPGSGMFSFTEDHIGSPTDPRGGEFPSPFLNSEEQGQSRRFDSGIGDSESEHGSSRRVRATSDAPSSTSASSSYPRLAKLAAHPEQHYEDIDAYKKYVRSDTSNSSETRRPDNGSVSRGRSRLPAVNISGVTHTESRDYVSAITQQHPMGRPYQDPRLASLPHTYSHLETNGYMVGPKAVENEKTRSWCCYLVTVLLLIFLMSAAALSLGVYLILNDGNESSPNSVSKVGNLRPGNSSGLTESLNALEEKIADLQKDLGQLQTENTNLKADMEKMNSDVQPLYKDISFLRDTHRDTIQSMTAIDDRLTSEIANISLTPGPQGPVGLFNFSLCVHKSIAENAIPSDRLPTTTPYLPGDKDIQDHVAIFAYCTMHGAQRMQLQIEQSQSSTISGTRYRCVCTGVVSGESNTKCVINVTLCPKLLRGSIP